MSRRTRVNSNNADVEERFASWIKMAIDIISPKDLFLVAGRATAKTSDIIAERSMDIIHDMPRSYQVFVSDTYVNAHKNIVPTLLEGWQRKGWREGVHFVVNDSPPSHFDRPYKPPMTYKNTISLWNGVFFNLVSMDQPTGAAGNSYQHMYGDEAKYLEFEKLKKLMPALRGFVEFGHSIYYRGSTFTTDMPQVAEGEHAWILDREKDMDVEQIKLAYQVGMVLNEIKKELYNAIRDNNKAKVIQLKKQLERWTVRWIRARKDSTFYYIVSSFVNADVLTEGYFRDSLKALGIEEFKTAILSLKENLKAGEKFYVNLGPHHFIEDGVIESFYDDVPIGDAIEETSLALKYIEHNKPLDAGADFGNMCSMVIGQERGNYNYLLKNIFTIAPRSTRHLANDFLSFFKHHKKKEINIYHDRSGNQYQQVNKDWAGELKEMIEKDEQGNTTGWHVNLMNRGQATILQQEEYNLMKMIFGEYQPGMPLVKIDKYRCRELKSSLELSKIVVKSDRKGSKTIHKDKSSEKLSLNKLPMYSTNMSDAMKYYFFRPGYVDRMREYKKVNMSAPGVV